MSILSCVRRFLLDILVVITAIFLFPGLPPNADFEATSFGAAPPLEGALAPNTRLSGMELLMQDSVEGPESTAEWRGAVYTSSIGGRIVRVTSDGGGTTVARLGDCDNPEDQVRCGYPLGIRFDQHGSLFVADAYQGILRVNVTSGSYEVVVGPGVRLKQGAAGGGSPLRLFNDVVVSKAGVVYFTTSSSICDIHDGFLELFVNGTGSLLRHDPRSGTTEVLLSGINFANGIALNADESAVVVSESAKLRLRRYWLSGPRAGTSDVFAENLPGIPDNIRVNSRGNYFVGICGMRKDIELHEKLKTMPWLSKFLSRLIVLLMAPIRLTEQFFPNVYTKHILYKTITISAASRVMRGGRPEHSLALELDQTGAIVSSFHSDQLSCISQLTEHKGALYVGSPFVDFLGRVRPKPRTLRVKNVKTTGDLDVSFGA